MRAKPEMKPWVNTEKKDDELRLGAALTASVGFVSLQSVDLHSLRKCRSYGAQKKVWKQLTQGLRPGLCRSVALAGLFYAFQNQ